MSDRTSLFKDVTTDLNEIYREVIALYQIGDTRVGYLRTLELALSQGCPDMQLWNFPNYMALPPLPEDPRAKISPGHFFNCLLVYEQIMREVGLIDKDPVKVNESFGDDLLDMGGD